MKMDAVQRARCNELEALQHLLVFELLRAKTVIRCPEAFETEEVCNDIERLLARIAKRKEEARELSTTRRKPEKEAGR